MSTVLVVEDDADHRALLDLRLWRMGYDVLSAGSAAEALTVVAEHGIPDVAVVDIVMNGVSGLEFLQNLRQEPACAQLPAILITARELNSDVDAARALGAAYLQKPVVFAALSAAIDRALTPSEQSD
jgi:CheY-like chemotaxis protein